MNKKGIAGWMFIVFLIIFAIIIFYITTNEVHLNLARANMYDIYCNEHNQSYLGFEDINTGKTDGYMKPVLTTKIICNESEYYIKSK